MASPEYFPVSFGELGASIRFSHLGGSEKTIDGTFTVRYLEQPHPGRSFAYSFEKNGVKVVYATDSELDRLILNRDETEKTHFALRRLPEDLVRFVAEADLLVADGQYTDAEYPKKVGWGHARATTAVDLAIQARVKQLAIYHHDPMHTDEIVDDTIGVCRARAAGFASNLVVMGAREGLELKM